MDTLIRIFEVAIGVGLIIFVHELGHFLAAKWVGIRVERFSLGFPPRLFGFEWRGTDYCLGAIPLGGYVKMAGEEPEEGGEVDPEPDSFPAKTVGQRALVISAGVIMNVLFAIGGFLVAFKMGVEMNVPAVGGAVPGSAADGALERGDEILAIDGRKPLDFHDVMMEAALAGEEGVELRVRAPGGDERTLRLRPRREMGEPAQRLGVEPIDEVASVAPGSAAAKAGLVEGDRLLSVAPRDEVVVTLSTAATATTTTTAPATAPVGPAEVAARLAGAFAGVQAVAGTRIVEEAASVRVHAALRLGADAEPARATLRALAQAMAKEASLPAPAVEVGREAPTRGRADLLAALAASPGVERRVEVLRGGAVIELAITPDARPVKDFGVQLAPAPVVLGVIDDAPADEGGLRPGDLVRAVNGEPARLATIVERVKAIAASDAPVITLEVERAAARGLFAGCGGARGAPETHTLTLHPQRRTNGPVIGAQFGAGVVAAVEEGSAAAAAGLEAGAVLLSLDGGGVSAEGLRAVATALGDGKQATLAWRTASGEEREAKLAPRVVSGAFYGDLGVELRMATFIPDAPGLIEPIRLGFAYTWINVERVLLTLGGMFAKKIDTSTLGGPITIASQAFEVTERGLGTLLYFLCMISVNLAVLNILPVPILDGGHLVFLLVERLKGSPVSITIRIRAQQVGVLLVLFLILFVTKNDIARLIAG